MSKPIKLSLKGFANYMIADSRKQRKILSDYKYPDPEGYAQATYYKEARDFIVTYHKNKHPPSWLIDRAVTLEGIAKMFTGQTKARYNHNARSLRGYSTHFGKKKFEILRDIKFIYSHAGVFITIVPELHVMEGQKEKLIKLEFSKDKPDEKIIKVITQLMYEVQDAAGQGLPGSCILYMDVARGEMHSGARAGSRIRAEIEAACDNIVAIWNSV